MWGFENHEISILLVLSPVEGEKEVVVRGAEQRKAEVLVNWMRTHSLRHDT